MTLAKAVGAVTLIFLASGPFLAGRAQVNPFWSSRFGPKLTEQDRQYLINGTNELNEGPRPRAGQSLSWSNPNTKAHGTIELLRVYRHNDMTCHAMRYRNTPPRGQTRTYNVNWCKSPDGWKVVS